MTELDTDALSRYVRQEMTERMVPGLALAVVTPDRPMWTAGFGVTAVDDGAPVTGRTLFRIASVTKVFTGVAVLRLVEQGVLDLDTTVLDHVPELRLRTRGTAERITLRMLLSHTSGLPEGSIERPWRVERRGEDGLDAFVREDLPRFPAVGEPGELYFYSNLAVNLAGHVAQRATGTPFPQLLDELALTPLGVERTTADPTVAMTFPLAQRHIITDGRLRVRHDGGDNTAFYPSGQLFSTAEDLGTLLQGLMGDLLSPRMTAEMRRPHADVGLARGLSSGLACMVEPDYKGVTRIGHEGVLRGYCAKIAWTDRVGVAVVYNHEYNEHPRFFASRDRIVDRVFDEVLGLPPGPVPPPATSVPGPVAERLTGRYAKVLSPSVVEVRPGRDGLTLLLEGVELPLSATGRGVFVGPRTDRDLAELPWPRTPYVIDDHVSVGAPENGPVHTITVNGQPYRRVE
ncbi:serine hydrolase domain-containing protein [Lentzea sp. NPDC005914]|uniref:serine hydrolase domain-containing protein n=1 Tax=Lentzea sp. NPDC005914 TaxID=3154572 RepID=UPI0033FC34BC